MKKIGIATLLLISAMLMHGKESNVTLKTSTGELYGSMISPTNESLSVAALLICGSGPTDRDGNNPMMKNNSIKYLAEDLAAAGIATIRYDKRGIAASVKAGPKEEYLRFTTYVDDAKGWIEMLSKEYKRVIVIGHSEGALIGAMATRGNSKVNGFVSLAGCGRPVDEVLIEQLSGMSPQIINVATPILESLKKGVPVKNVPPSMYSLFRPSVQPYMMSWLKINPQEEIAAIKVPVLILQGDKDIQIKTTDADLLHQGQPKAKKVIIKNMNHVFKQCDTMDAKVQQALYNKPMMRNIELLKKEIISFIL